MKAFNLTWEIISILKLIAVNCKKIVFCDKKCTFFPFRVSYFLDNLNKLPYSALNKLFSEYRVAGNILIPLLGRKNSTSYKEKSNTLRYGCANSFFRRRTRLKSTLVTSVGLW